MLNRPLSKIPTDAVELCNCSFDMQPNLIKNACHLLYQYNKEILSCYNIYAGQNLAYLNRRTMNIPV